MTNEFNITTKYGEQIQIRNEKRQSLRRLWAFFYVGIYSFLLDTINLKTPAILKKRNLASVFAVCLFWDTGQANFHEKGT